VRFQGIRRGLAPPAWADPEWDGTGRRLTRRHVQFALCRVASRFASFVVPTETLHVNEAQPRAPAVSEAAARHSARAIAMLGASGSRGITVACTA
jgi:hypothetical protein